MRHARHVGKIVLTVPRPRDPGGTVLITGGTGALGSLLARHLAAERGVTRLLLVSRRGPAAGGASDLRAELSELGCDARIEACDTTDRDQLAALVESIPPEHPLTAVIHAAGVVDDGVIDSLTGERIDRVFAPKAGVAQHLHELTRDIDLESFVMFSSAAATFGAPGQGNYAAANAFLDALAVRRRAQGLAASSLAWGLWQTPSGMTGELGEADLARMARAGVGALSTQAGLELFDGALALGDPVLLPMRLETAELRAHARAGALPALLRDLVRVPGRRPRDGAGSLARRLAAVPEAERDQFVLDELRTQVAAVLGHPSGDAIDPERAFKDLGFDSLGAVELRNRLAQATGLKLGPTLVFDYPTPAALAGYLRSQIDAPQQATIDDELNKLEAMLPPVGSDDAERRRIAARLKALMADLAPSAAADGEGVVETIEAASADELFKLIDEQPGQ